MLREKEHTVKEIADKLGMTPQNIYHHMNKLQDEGIVKLNYERRSGHIIESYYSVPSDTFVFSNDVIRETPIQQALAVINGLQELGINVNPSIVNASELEEIYLRYQNTLDNPVNTYAFCKECSSSGLFMKFGPMNPILLNRVMWYANLVQMNEEEFEELIENYRELRKTLRKMVTK
jgi:DNA-binding transcriptional ArsR family regulator